MGIINDNAEQNIITLLEGEVSFFENFTKKHGISWTYEEKQNNILPLSKSYVGYINTPLRTITLKPKYKEIGFEHIVRLYLYVYGYRPTDSAAVLDVSSTDNSVDVADMFIKNLKRNIQEGVIRTYERKETKLSTIRGRVNYVDSYISLMLHKRKPIKARVSSLSIENDVNALIMTALTKLRHIKKYTAVATELAMYFEGAADNITNGSAVLESINFNSNTSRYRKTLTYAAMIVDQLTYSDTGSTVGTDSFIINFDRLFEDFVAKALKEFPEKKEFSTWSSKKKFADVIGAGGKYDEREYQPDIIFRYLDEDERYDYLPSAYAVLDVKNKAYNQFKNPDIYQILTYAKLLHCEKAVLLYPSFHKRTPEQLSLDSSIFTPSIVYSCFVNIAEENGEAFLDSIRWFADVVVKTVLDIPL